MTSHPLQKFSFCPQCGSSRFENHDFKSRRCLDCGFTFYLNSAASVVGLILNDKGELLVGRRAFEPAQHTLDLPGGFVDPGESLEQALQRELLEEIGQPVTSLRWLFSLPNEYLFSGMIIPTTDSFFLCGIEHPEAVSSGDDLASLRWLKPSEIHFADFGLLSIRRGLQHFIHSFPELLP